MVISYSILSSISKAVYSMAKDSPLKKAAKQQFEMALYDLESINEESHYRECLNRVLTHLESAYALYLPTIKTWDIFDSDRNLWDKRTFANDICFLIAVLHYILGNKVIAKKWLIENLDNMGSIYFPNVEGMPIHDIDSFFREIGQSDYPKLKCIKSESERNYDCTYNTWEDPSPGWDHYD